MTRIYNHFLFKKGLTNTVWSLNALRYILLPILCIAFMLCSASPAFCQTKRYFVKKIGAGTDLDHSCVWALHLSASGILWAGTDNGLFRFDGVQLMQFNTGADSRLRLKWEVVNKIAEDEKARLWICTNGTVQVINQYTLSLIPLKQIPFPDTGFYRQIVSICQGPDKAIYFRTTDAVYEFKNDQFSRILQFSSPGQTFFYDNQDTVLYLNGPEEGLYAFKKNTLKRIDYKVFFTDHSAYGSGGPLNHLIHTPLCGIADSMILNIPPGYILHVEQGRNNQTVYEAGEIDELQQIFPPFKEVSKYFYKDSTFAQSFNHAFRLQSLRKINKNTWALGTSVGLYLVSEKDIPFQHIAFSKGNSIRGITEDSQGHLLAGGYSGVLDCTSNQKFTMPFIWDFLPMNDHQFWVSCESFAGLWKLTRTSNGGFKVEEHPQSNEFQFCKSLEVTPKGFWAGGYYEKLFHVDRQSGRFSPSPFNKDFSLGNLVKFIKFSPDGYLWVGGVFGLRGFRTTTDGDITAQIPDANIPEALRSGTVNALYIDQQKALWVGASDKGLFRFVYGSDKPVRQWTTTEGLSHNTVYSILGSNADSVLWLGTEKGLCRMSVPIERFNSFFAEDGLGQNEFNTGARYRSADGTYYFGGINGISKFRPEAVSIPETMYSIYTQISVTSTNQPSQRFMLPTNGQTVTIDPDEIYMEIEFRTDDLFKGQEMICRYRIDPINQNWRVAPISEKLTLAGLKPGTYKLEYQARLPEGEWSRLQSIQLNILAPWYQSNWFIGLCLFAIAFVIYFIYRQRLNEIRKEMELRQSVSDDLHDSLGSRLYLLKSLASKIVHTSDEHKSKELIRSFETQATEATRTIRNFIWAFGPTADDLQDVSQRLEDFAENYLRPILPEFIFEQADLPSNYHISPRIKHHVVQIYQELLTNMVKHTHCVSIHIKIYCIPKSLVVEITNHHDGIRNEMNSNENSFGMQSMQTRMRDIEADIQWHEQNEKTQEAVIMIPKSRA
jgi:signal transduction histidine kinase